mgnify:CR=1 FL=1
MNDNNKKKRFKLFDYQREGKGISKNQPELAPGFKKFFISYKNNFISDKSFIFPNWIEKEPSLTSTLFKMFYLNIRIII